MATKPMTAPSPFGAFGTRAEGARFVGRETSRQRIFERLFDASSSAALVGLPGVGKSSLAKVVADDIAERGEAVPWISAGSFESGIQLLVEIEAILIDRVADDPTSISRPPIENHTLAATARRCRSSLSDMHARGLRQIIVIDDLDQLRHWEDGAQLIRQLRELVHQPQRFPLVVLFVARRSLEQLELQMTGISTFVGVVDQRFLQPFTLDEVEEMCERSSLTAGVAAQVWEASGGHPRLCEALCHAAYLREEADDRVRADVEGWVLKFLREEDLLERLRVLSVEGGRLSLLEPDGLLDAYGLCSCGEVTPWGRQLVRAAFSLPSAPGQPRMADYPDDLPSEILRLCAGGESRTVEFKSTFCYDIEVSTKNHQPTRNTAIETAALKTIVGFANSREGGVLLVGVNDDGTIFGLDADLEVLKGSLDKLKRHVSTAMTNRVLGGEWTVFVDLSVTCVPGPLGDDPRWVMRFLVKPAHHEVYLGSAKGENGHEKFYLRREAQTVELVGQKLSQYARFRFPRGGA